MQRESQKRKTERERDGECVSERCPRVYCALAAMKFVLLSRKFLAAPATTGTRSWVQAHVILLCDKDELVRRYPAAQQQQRQQQ